MPLSRMAPASMPIWPPRCVTSGMRASPTSAKTPTSTALHSVPNTGPLPERNPQEQHEEADDHHDCADAQPGLDRKALVKDVPGVQAQPGADKNGERKAVHGQADEELEESAGQHGVHPPRKLALQSIASLKYWPDVRLFDSRVPGSPAGRVEPRRRPRLPRARRRRPPAHPRRPRRPRRRPAQRTVPGRRRSASAAPR